MLVYPRKEGGGHLGGVFSLLLPLPCSSLPLPPSPCAERDVDTRAVKREAPEALVLGIASLGLHPGGHAAVQLPHQHAERINLVGGGGGGGGGRKVEEGGCVKAHTGVYVSY